MVAHVSTKGDVDLTAELKQKFESVFQDGLGTCTKEKAALTLLPGAKPVYRMKRPVAHASLEVVEKEIERLVDMGVIEPITHSEWAAPIVCVRKANGKMRVCADFSTGLNKALEDYEYPIPIPEDIFASLNGGTMFSQIDFSDAYLQVELTNEAKEVVVINTHKGLYRYKRLPFGIKTAPGIFQSIMNKMISGLDGVAAYLDDIVVVGKTPEEHKRNLFALFESIAEYGFRVRLEKCSFAKPEIKFLGFIVDREGRSPNPEKVIAISKMPAPQSVTQLRAFLGMVTYYSSFIPNMKELRANRLMRWATMLIGYDFDIEYIKTDSFGQDDGLSRLLQRHPLTQEDCVIASVEVDVKQVFADAVRRLPVTAETIRKHTEKSVIQILSPQKACQIGVTVSELKTSQKWSTPVIPPRVLFQGTMDHRI
ncbi:reverse transcriptase [Ancylostoma ceylanicum]|uniref:Reverse transcriptase n=1 Tax=Ancylostoma ceylanicum TaxID=53326 RepID=A0A0D6LYR9_9BILA|nr:reverse transcriptase [Ancylostoma ceylanicum]